MKKLSILIILLVTFAFIPQLHALDTEDHSTDWDLYNVVGDIASYRFSEDIPFSVTEIEWTISDILGYNVQEKNETPYTAYSQIVFEDDEANTQTLYLDDIIGLDLEGTFSVDLVAQIVHAEGHIVPLSGLGVITHIYFDVVQTFDYSSPPPGGLAVIQEYNVITYSSVTARTWTENLWFLENPAEDIASFSFDEDVDNTVSSITWNIDDTLGYNSADEQQGTSGTVYSRLVVTDDEDNTFSMYMTDIIGIDMEGEFSINFIGLQLVAEGYTLNMYGIENISHIYISILQTFDYSTPPAGSLGTFQQNSTITYASSRTITNDDIGTDETTAATWFQSLMTDLRLNSLVAYSFIFIFGSIVIVWALRRFQEIMFILLFIWLVFATWIGMIPLFMTAIIGLLELGLLIASFGNNKTGTGV